MQSRRWKAALGLALVVAIIAAVPYRGSLRARYVRWRHPRIVFVTFDTLNIRYTSVYDSKRDTTPNLVALADDGVRLQHAYTTVPITLPSHTAMFSGRHPVMTGVMRNGDSVPPELPLLAEVLRDQGYRTGAFISLGVLRSTFGIGRGFDTYDDAYDETVGRWYRTADEVVEPAMRWLEGVGNEPYFLWVHLSDPHEPYLAPGAAPDLRVTLDGVPIADVNGASKVMHSLPLRLTPGRHVVGFELLPPWVDGPSWLRVRFTEPQALAPFRDTLPGPVPDEIAVNPSRRVVLVNDSAEVAEATLQFVGALKNPPGEYVREQYQEEVRFADRQLGRLRDYLRVRGHDDSTLWVIASDHGEGLFHHSLLGHAAYAREDQLRALWILRGPGVPPGQRIETPALLEDLAPTVLDILGLPASALPGADGRSMRACWSASGTCTPRSAWWSYGIGENNDAISSLAGYRWPYKILLSEVGRNLYELTADPAEDRDLLTAPAADRPLPAAARSLVDELPARERAVGVALEHRGQAGRLSDDEQEMLRSLGYLQ